jgi:hypothetical protein
MAFSDGVTGILVWGGRDTINVTVSRGDLWDHRNGSKWTSSQNYFDMARLLKAGKTEECKTLFIDPPVPKNEPRNPLLLPLGRVVVKVPGKTLQKGQLDPFTGIGELSFVEGGKVKLAMCKATRSGCFSMKFEQASPIDVKCFSSMDFKRTFSSLSPIGYKLPKRFAGKTSGFVWDVLGGEKKVALKWSKAGDELFIQTTRDEEYLATPVEKMTFAEVEQKSRMYWTKFWECGARVKIPDREIQDVFDYGMYRFGAMTDKDGVPAGLQGPWLEDHKRAPWSGDYHLNINVQECYMPAYKSGHFENLMPLFKMILSWKSILRQNAKFFAGIDDGYALPHATDDRGSRLGAFASATLDRGSTMWIAHMMFKYVKYSNDVEFLKNDAYDFMLGSFNTAYAIMDKSGEYSYAFSPSPEYVNSGTKEFAGRNSSFQLASTHRLARDLSEACEILGYEKDPRFHEVMTRLPKYNAGRFGIRLFGDQELDSSHRHHSHLAGIYPFDTIDMSCGEEAKAVRKAYDKWVEEGHGAWVGWSCGWASAIHVCMSNSVAAVEMLRSWRRFFCDEGFGSHHNAVHEGWTSYVNGRSVMQMDGHMGVVAAILELMVNEENGKPVFFKGCPQYWNEVSFENIALSDGRRVSGWRKNGKVKIEFKKTRKGN